MLKRNLKKIVFLDRDGVINKKAGEHQYITEIKDFIFNEGIFDILLRLKVKGFEFIIITNQRGIARGLLSEKKLHQIHQYMLNEFHKKKIEILDIFHCPHDNDSCECRKPKNGMLIQATEKYNIDLSNSILVSDSKEDIEMGERFGIAKNIIVPSDKLESLNQIN